MRPSRCKVAANDTCNYFHAGLYTMHPNNSQVRDIQTDLNRVKQDETYLFIDKNFQESIIEYFQFLRMEAILCDVTLRLASQRFPCHRNVLGVASPYFRALFIDNETGKFIKNVELPRDLSYSIVEALLAYMYGGKIFITINNVIEIFKGANFFKLHSLMEECSHVLVKFLTPENCLEIQEISLTYGCERLYQRSQRFVYENFEIVAGTPQFLELAQCDLETLLSSNDIHATSELQVFDSLVRWIENDRKKRGVQFAKLLRHVRLPLLSTNVLMDHVVRQELVHRSPTAKEMVLEALRLNTAQDSSKSALNKPNIEPRTCSTLVNVIMFVGGKGTSTMDSLVTFCYEPEENKWYTLAPLRTKLYDHTVAAVDGLVFACAGSVEGKASLLLQDKVQCFNAHLNQWDFVAPLLESRAKAASVEHEGLLYVAGGMMDGSHGNSFEVYNPINDKWKHLSSPNIPRLSHAMVTTASHIYVIGGEGQGSDPEISMERYDPAVNVWSFVLPMNCGKVGACAVALNEKIYVMGGYNGFTTLRQCEVYDIETHQWHMLQDMTEFRQDAQAVTLNNKIYVIGGRHYRRGRLLNSIECYDVSQREWTRVTSVPVTKEGFKCVTIKISRCHLIPMNMKYPL